MINIHSLHSMNPNYSMAPSDKNYCLAALVYLTDIHGPSKTMNVVFVFLNSNWRFNLLFHSQGKSNRWSLTHWYAAHTSQTTAKDFIFQFGQLVELISFR